MTSTHDSPANEEPGLPSAEEPHTPLLRDLRFTKSPDPAKAPNPWLWNLGILGVISFVVGMALFVQGVTDVEDVIMMWWGFVLSFLGMMMLTGALVAGAVCWQLRNRATS